MNKRIVKKKSDRVLYPDGKKMKKRNQLTRKYVSNLQDLPNHLWLFYESADGWNIIHKGISKEYAIYLYHNGLQDEEYRIDYIITTLDLKVVIESGQRIPIVVNGRYAQVGARVFAYDYKPWKHPSWKYVMRHVDLLTKRAADYFNEILYPDRCEFDLAHLRYICIYTSPDGKEHRELIPSGNDMPLKKEELIKIFDCWRCGTMLGISAEYRNPEHYKIETIVPKLDVPIFKIVYEDWYEIVWAYCHAENKEEALEIFDREKNFISKDPQSVRIIETYKSKLCSMERWEQE